MESCSGVSVSGKTAVASLDHGELDLRKSCNVNLSF